MYFYQFSLTIINFLEESYSFFLAVYYFYVTRPPTRPSFHINPIFPSISGQFFPLGKLFFIGCTRGHEMP